MATGRRRSAARGGGPPGVALVLASGILGLLALLAAALAGTARLTRARAAGVALETEARLGAASGMAYAAARLAREGYPRRAGTPAERGDDLSCEGSSSPEGSWNPSYAHGERWVDDLSHPFDGLDNDGDGQIDEYAEGVGVYTPGEAWGPDLDGDGALTAFSGRLRARGGAFASVFSLGIEPVGGRVPVNAGVLDPPRHNSEVPYVHVDLGRLLDNLGAVVLETNPAIGRLDVPAGWPVPGEPIRVSFLGRDLLSRRPPGGYRNLDEVDAALAAAGYASAERARVLPFLDTGPYEALDDAFDLMEAMTGAPTGRVVPIEFASAPPEVLQAYWMYLQPAYVRYPIPDADGNGGLSLPYGEVGRRAGGNLSHQRGRVIYPDEARALADWAVEYRDRAWPAVSWLALRRDLTARAPDIFSEDRVALAAAGRPLSAALWVRAKADLAFFAMRGEGPSYPTFNWMTWGVDHPFGGPEPFQSFLPHFYGGGYATFARPVVPFPDPPWGPWGIGNHANGPYDVMVAATSRRLPLLGGMTLGPVASYRVACAARRRDGAGRPVASARAAGRFRALERLTFESQEDFENLRGGPGLRRNRGIVAVDPLPASRRAVRSDPSSDLETGDPVVDPQTGEAPAYPWVASLPNGNARGFRFHEGPGRIHQFFDGRSGALALAVRACGNQGSIQYWPFMEDGAVEEPAPEREFVSWPLSDSLATSVAFDVPRPYLSSPWGYTHLDGPASVPFSVPGLFPPGAPVAAATIEAWVGENGSLQVSHEHGGLEIAVRRPRDDLPGQREGSYLNVAINGWPVAGGGLDLTEDLFSGVHVPLVRRGVVRSGHGHVVLVIAREGTQTRFDLYIDGEAAAPSRWVDAVLLAPTETRLKVDFADEVRLYEIALSAGQVWSRYRLGRFVKPGADGDPETAVYRSPLYDLGKTGRLVSANWTGIPAADGTGAERVDIRVAVRGYDAAGAEVPGSPAPLPFTEAASDLVGLGPIRAFRYEVAFVGADPDDGEPLYHTPFFDGVWFALSRPGRAPVWIAWSSR